MEWGRSMIFDIIDGKIDFHHWNRSNPTYDVGEYGIWLIAHRRPTPFDTEAEWTWSGRVYLDSSSIDSIVDMPMNERIYMFLDKLGIALIANHGNMLRSVRWRKIASNTK